jgi:hypothetical protein
MGLWAPGEWTQTPYPTDDPYAPQEGQRVTRTGYDTGPSEGVVVGWAAGTENLRKATETGDEDWLVDSEGPLVRFDDQDPGDEELHWFPGQGMGALTLL